jgi:hypothetical protein
MKEEGTYLICEILLQVCRAFQQDLQRPENQILFFSTFDEMMALLNSRLKILHKPIYLGDFPASAIEAQLLRKFIGLKFIW